MPSWRRPLLPAALLVLGCVHPRPPPVQGWRELRSAHFLLRTDLPDSSARTTLEKLETLRWWLQSAWSTGGDSPGMTQAVVLASPDELRTFIEMVGVAITSREGPLLVTMGFEWAVGDRSPEVRVLAHEVAHELIRRRMPGAPRWFHEGLAGYLESVTALDDGHVRFTLVDPQDHPGPRDLDDERPLLSLDETASRRWETATDAELADLYRSARVWVALLRAEEPARMRALEADLAAGMSWGRAWVDLRSRLDLPRLQEKLWRLRHAGGWPREVRAFTPLTAADVRSRSERTLGAWEVHLCLAQLWGVAARTRGSEPLSRNVRAELEAAAVEAPDEPLPQVRLAALERDRDVRRARAEALVERFPRSPEARVFLAGVLRDDGGPPEGRRAAVLAAISLAPDSVDALTAHALEEMRSGNAEGALRRLGRAEELEPWNSTVFVVRALVLGATGRCDEAADAAQRAIDVLPDDPVPIDLRTLVQERERIIGACQDRTGP